MKKQVVKINEAQLKQIVTESVKRMLSERIAGEKGMSDDEVIRRRNDNFVKDMDYAPNSLWDDGSFPGYLDRLGGEWYYDEPNSVFDRITRDRKLKHYATQNHKSHEDTITEIEDPEFYSVKNNEFNEVMEHLTAAYDSINGLIAGKDTDSMTEIDWELNSIKGAIHNAMLKLRRL